MNLSEFLETAATAWPQKPAFIEDNKTLSYATLLESIADFSAQLQTLGLSPGCRVGVWLPNSVAYVALTFALWRNNAVVVPVPIECPEKEVSTIAATLQLGALLSQKPFGKSVPVGPDCFFTALTPPEPPDNHGLNIAFIRFTSGTTSARKGVVLCHETILDRIMAANQALGIESDDTIMWCLPMSHHFLITIVLYLFQGATVVLARHVLAAEFLQTVNRWQATVLYAAPFHYALLARDASGAALSTVRLAISTTCALPRDVAEDFYERFGRPIRQALGIIELGLVSLNQGDPLGRWNSVGRPVPNLRLRIIAPDAQGCGEVAVSGPGILDAYAAPWLLREQVLQEGWFITGDIGRLDANGYLFLAGRKNAVINLAGRKVFPEEIEAVLNRHPAVRESRVFGRLHSHLGEVIEADVVLAQPEADPETVREYCRANLASFKIPSRLHVVASLPRTTATGKLRRAAALAWHD